MLPTPCSFPDIPGGCHALKMLASARAQAVPDYRRLHAAPFFLCEHIMGVPNTFAMPGMGTQSKGHDHLQRTISGSTVAHRETRGVTAYMEKTRL